MDDVTSTLPGPAAPSAGAGSKPFASKPRRLARGLNDLFARPQPPTTAAAAVPAPKVDAPSAAPVAEAPVSPREDAPAAASNEATPVAGKSAAAEEPIAAPALPAAAEPVRTDAGRLPRAGAGTIAATIPSETSTDPAAQASAFEYRFVQLLGRLDATCNLLADARQTQQAAAQRTTRVTLSAAALLVIIAGGMLWWAGSLAAWNQSRFEYESTRSTTLEKSFHALTAEHAAISTTHQSLSDQHAALAKQHEQLLKQHETVRSEIDTIRASLSKANVVIDELMSKPAEDAAQPKE